MKIAKNAFALRKKPAALVLLFSAFALILCLFAFTEVSLANTKIPSLNVNLGESDDPTAVVPAMKILGFLTIMSVAPSVLLMMTSFTRILIVLSFLRQALGTPSMPPNQVLLGLSLFLTMFTMGPVWDQVNEKAVNPYMQKAISQEQALSEAGKPVREFMLAETRETDLALFFNLAKTQKPKSSADVPFRLLMPAFMISELKTAFQIGFIVYVPFLVIDMVVSSILMAMGMMMLQPTIVSLPFKLALFVLVDGWSLVISSLVRSFNVTT